jgi:Na+/melibiose symporter-like transporter
MHAQRRRRLRRLMCAGLADSLCLSFGWTVLMLRVVAVHGLAVAGVVSAAMLLGVALSAPVATRLARRLGGRRLLRAAASVEAVLRLLVFVLLVGDASTLVLATCVCVMNVMAWTGYAGMRAEVTAVSPGAGALTWYGAGVAAIEAVGAPRCSVSSSTWTRRRC